MEPVVKVPSPTLAAFVEKLAIPLGFFAAGFLLAKMTTRRSPA